MTLNGLLAAVVLLLVLLTAACAGGTDLPPVGEPWPALPAPAELDLLRGASVAQTPFDVTAPLLSDNTSPLGEALAFAPQGGQMAYAVFRAKPPLLSVIGAAASGADGLYLLVADYASGSWTGAMEFAGGFALLQFDGLDVLSPAGYVYCAVVAPVGVQGQLTSLVLNYDGVDNIYFVAPPEAGGNDANSGGFDAPWATLQHAADAADPGSLVLVAAGTYAPFQIATGATADAPVIFRGGEEVTIDGTGSAYGIDIFGANHIIVEGFFVLAANVGIRSTGDSTDITIRKNNCNQCIIGGIMVDFTDRAVVEWNAVTSSENAYGILLINGCDDAVLRNNLCYMNGGLGISCWALNNNGDATMTGAELSGNTVFGSNTTFAGYGLWIEGLSDSRIANNLFFFNGGGVMLSGMTTVPATNNLFVNNTIVQGGALEDALPCVKIEDDCTGNRFLNNILLTTHAAAATFELNEAALTSMESDYNVTADRFQLGLETLTLAEWQSATTLDQNSYASTPELTFLNPASFDFKLQPGASAVDNALGDVAPPVDLLGVLRPQGDGYDIGCYEHVP